MTNKLGPPRTDNAAVANKEIEALRQAAIRAEVKRERATDAMLCAVSAVAQLVNAIRELTEEE